MSSFKALFKTQADTI